MSTKLVSPCGTGSLLGGQGGVNLDLLPKCALLCCNFRIKSYLNFRFPPHLWRSYVTKDWELASLRAPDTSLKWVMGELRFWGISLKMDRTRAPGLLTLGRRWQQRLQYFSNFYFGWISLFMTKLGVLLSFHILVSISSTGALWTEALGVPRGCAQSLGPGEGSTARVWGAKRPLQQGAVEILDPFLPGTQGISLYQQQLNLQS